MADQTTTDWPFDADRDDPLVALRIPVTHAYPGWRYIATFDRDSAARPSDVEAAMIASFIEHYIGYWFNDWYKAKLAERPLDVDSGCNTITFHKYADGDWGYRRSTWEYGPIFSPAPPWCADRKGPLALTEVMDRAHSFGVVAAAARLHAELDAASGGARSHRQQLALDRIRERNTRIRGDTDHA